jgi:hypothetical protein
MKPMRLRLLLVVAAAGMLPAFVPNEAAAAPMAGAALPTVMPLSDSAELIYYYQGHHYPYHYNGHYYHHRSSYHGHYRYY